MMKKIPILIMLTALVFSLAASTAPYSFAQAATDNDSTVTDPSVITDSLLAILNVTQREVNATFTRLQEQNITIPDDAQDEYNEAVVLTSLAFQLREAGDFAQANEKALQAMRHFKNALLEIAEETEEAQEQEREQEQTQAQEALINQTAAFQRAQFYIMRLENITDKAEELGYNVTDIRSTLEDANQYLDNAETLLEQGNVDEAGVNIGRAISTAAKVNSDLRPIVKAHKIAMAEKFIEKAEKRLDRLQERLDKLKGRIDHFKEQALMNQIRNEQRRAERLRTMLQNDNLDAIIAELESMRESTETTTDQIQQEEQENEQD